jgi:putative transposase
METERDHIHLLIQYPPKECISNIAKILKQQSTWMMWQKYGEYLKTIYWNQRVFWSNGYFYASIGEVSESTISNYMI